jgi:hypothetical protein
MAGQAVDLNWHRARLGDGHAVLNQLEGWLDAAGEDEQVDAHILTDGNALAAAACGVAFASLNAELIRTAGAALRNTDGYMDFADLTPLLEDIGLSTLREVEDAIELFESDYFVLRKIEEANYERTRA